MLLTSANSDQIPMPILNSNMLMVKRPLFNLKSHKIASSLFPYDICQTTQHSVVHHSLIHQVFAETPDHLNDLIRLQTLNSCLHHLPDTRFVYSNETLIVHKCEKAHDELTIHTVRYPAVARNRLAEVLDLEGALESRGEEATEWRDERGEGCEDKYVKLHWSNVKNCRDGKGAREREVGEHGWNVVGTGNEDWIRSARKPGENVCPKVLQTGQHLMKIFVVKVQTILDVGKQGWRNIH